ncbi:unnamed protein product, partial [Iphiclides podalirius]
MDPLNDSTDLPLSEVGSQGQPSEERRPPDKDNASGLLSNMETLLTRLLAAQQPNSTSMDVLLANVTFVAYLDTDKQTVVDAVRILQAELDHQYELPR